MWHSPSTVLLLSQSGFRTHTTHTGQQIVILGSRQQDDEQGPRGSKDQGCMTGSIPDLTLLGSLLSGVVCVILHFFRCFVVCSVRAVVAMFVCTPRLVRSFSLSAVWILLLSSFEQVLVLFFRNFVHLILRVRLLRVSVAVAGRTSRDYRGVLKYLSWVQRFRGTHEYQYKYKYNRGIVLIKLKLNFK